MTNSSKGENQADADGTYGEIKPTTTDCTETNIKKIQQTLIATGYWTNPDVGATGNYGDMTKNSLVKFQRGLMQLEEKDLKINNNQPLFDSSNKLIIANYYGVGEKTAKALSKYYNRYVKNKKGYLIGTADYGTSSENVRNIQKLLIALNCWTKSGQEPTGNFLDVTKDSLIKFQKTRMMLTDSDLHTSAGNYVGCGPRTAKALSAFWDDLELKINCAMDLSNISNISFDWADPGTDILDAILLFTRR